MKWVSRVAVVIGAVAAAAVVVLALRPGRADSVWGAWDFVRVTAMAATVAIGALGVAVAAHARRQWTLALAAAGVAALVPLGTLRYPSVPRFGMALVVLAWFGSAVPVISMAIGSSVARGRPLPLVARISLALVGVSAVGVALADRGQGLGSYLAGPPLGDITDVARGALALHLVVTAISLVLVGRCVADVSGTGRDPITWAALVWAGAAMCERAVHLGGPGRYDLGIVGRYSTRAMTLGVHLPLMAALALVVTVGWVTAVRPRFARLPTGTIVVPDRDPFEVIRADLAAWLGDPTLTVTVADSNESADPGERDAPHRTTTQVHVDATLVAVLHHDVALARATQELHTTAVLAGLASDANRLLAVELSSLNEARQLAQRLVGADAEVRAQVAEELAVGPVARLWRCAEALEFGASLEQVSTELRAITADVRLLSHGLSPPELHSESLRGLLPAHAGAPEWILPPAIQVTAYLLAADDPQCSFELHDDRLDVMLGTHQLDEALADRVAALGGSIVGRRVGLPLDPEWVRPSATVAGTVDGRIG